MNDANVVFTMIFYICLSDFDKGDRMLDGDELRPPSGHFTDDRKPKGFDIRRIFLSPTILYAGMEMYAPRSG